MEATGLILAIPGLVVACVDIIELVETYKSSEVQSRQLHTRVKQCRLILKRWADAVGILDGKLQPSHHALLDDLETSSVVIQTLHDILEVFSKAEEVQQKLYTPKTQNNPDWKLPQVTATIDTGTTASRKSASSTRQSIRWTLKGKMLLTEQVEALEALIGNLYTLVPPEVHEPSGHPSRVNTDDIENLKNYNMDRTYIAIDKWLDIRDIDQSHGKILGDRLTGTCEWITRVAAYSDWISTTDNVESAKFLWIHGPAGHGKSVTCAYLFEDLINNFNTPSVYLSSSSHIQAGEQPETIIRYWLSQLSKTNEKAFQVIRSKMPRGTTLRKASATETWSILEIIVRSVDHCTLVLDGFDQYEQIETKRKDFLRMLKATVEGTKTRCLIVSRNEADINSELRQNVTSPEKHVMYEFQVSKENLQADIKRYSDHVINTRLSKKNESFRQQLSAEMAESCNGMFLLIKLQQEQLRATRDQKALQNVVRSMPDGLDRSYDQKWKTIQSLPSYDRDRAISILRWVVFAFRPLTVEELVHAVLIDPDSPSKDFPIAHLPIEIDEEYINLEIWTLCGSLIEIRSATKDDSPAVWTVHLTHPSVREYLLKVLPKPPHCKTTLTAGENQNLQHTYLAKASLRYLDMSNVWESMSLALVGISTCSALLEYTGSHWYRHLPLSDAFDEDLDALISTFFDPLNLHFKYWIRDYMQDTDEHEFQSAACMYYASFLGLTSTMSYLHQADHRGYDLIGGGFGSKHRALIELARKQALQIPPELRLDVDEPNHQRKPISIVTTTVTSLWNTNRGNLDLIGGPLGTALEAASGAGQRKALELLLGWGADVNRLGGKYGTALNAAIVGRHVDIVNLLIERGASIENRDEDYDWTTPMHHACANLNPEIIATLSSNGLSVDVLDSSGRTPLHIAARDGDADVVRFLLNQKARTETKARDGGTPLCDAVSTGKLGIVVMLLNHGADTSFLADKSFWIMSPKRHWSPFFLAIRFGQLEIFKVLLDHGADSSTAPGVGWMPLHVAASFGQLTMMDFLLTQGGSNISERTSEGNTPLHMAAAKGQLQAAEWLLSHGSDISAVNEKGKTPLWEAVNDGHANVVEMLLKRTHVEIGAGIELTILAIENLALDIPELFRKYVFDQSPMGNEEWHALWRRAVLD